MRPRSLLLVLPVALAGAAQAQAPIVPPVSAVLGSNVITSPGTPPARPMQPPIVGSSGAFGAPINQPFPSVLQGEALAAPTPTTPRVSATVAVSPVAVVNPFTIRGVSVTLPDKGFAREAALEAAARQALPQALQLLPLSAADARRTARSVGTAMQFVSSYQIVQETLLPTYRLVTDLTFNESMLRTNFGGKLVASSTVVVSGSAVSGSVPAAVSVSAPAPLAPQWIVRVASNNPADLDRAFRALQALPQANVTYRLIAGAGAEWNVGTSAPLSAIEAAAGPNGSVRPTAVVLPTPPTAQ